MSQQTNSPSYSSAGTTARFAIALLAAASILCVLVGLTELSWATIGLPQVELLLLRLPLEATSIIAYIAWVVFFTICVVVPLWIYRARKNLDALSVSGLSFSPFATLLWIVIPPFTLWRTQRTACELWKASDPEIGLTSPADWTTVKTSAPLNWWCVSWVLLLLFLCIECCLAAVQHLWNLFSWREYIRWLHLFWLPMLIDELAFCLLTLWLIKSIQDRQDKRHLALTQQRGEKLADGAVPRASKDWLLSAICIIFVGAVAMAGTVTPSYNSRGDSYFALEDYQKAIDEYSNVIKLTPNSANAYHSRGAAYSWLHQYDKAVYDYNMAVSLNPRSALIYWHRGQAYYGLGQYQRAIEDYSKAISLDSKDVRAYIDRGNAFMSLRKYQQSLDDFTKAIVLNPKDANSYRRRAWAHRRLGQYLEAIADYSKYISLVPEEAQAYYDRAEVYESLQQHDKAIDDYAKTISLYPYPVGHYIIEPSENGSTQSQATEHRSARPLIGGLNTAGVLRSLCAAAYYKRGKIYETTGKHDLAMKDQEKAKDVDSEELAKLKKKPQSKDRIRVKDRSGEEP